MESIDDRLQAAQMKSILALCQIVEDLLDDKLITYDPRWRSTMRESIAEFREAIRKYQEDK